MFRNESLRWIYLPAVLLIGLASMRLAPAQTGGGIGFGQLDLVRQIRLTVSAVRQYRLSHAHFPQQTDELDAALKSIYQFVTMSAPDPSVSVQSRGQYRTYYQFAMALDSSIHAVPVINGRVRVPDSWDAPPNTITILTDGADMFAVWAASGDRHPINDPTTNNPLVIMQTVDCAQTTQAQ